MTVVLYVAGGMLLLAAGLLVVRITAGPTILDRSMALDVMMSVMVCGMSLWAAHQDSDAALPAILALAAIGFVGSVAVARYANGSDDVEAENDQQEEENA
ncbi:monovalent cation/H+ antiporter complex subunit F [Nocardioides solisilvae]|uniref:monovalent cation/H+ antiporter complex subunit F n=1 Tax=Nocardioides solisilvae TaxID=1542435 RepID=UPI000D748B23|nr:monovalent cation/H+ antiporter complex subunit F [Nocardioides solisilvae]